MIDDERRRAFAAAVGSKFANPLHSSLSGCEPSHISAELADVPVVFKGLNVHGTCLQSNILLSDNDEVHIEKQLQQPIPDGVVGPRALLPRRPWRVTRKYPTNEPMIFSVIPPTRPGSMMPSSPFRPSIKLSCSKNWIFLKSFHGFLDAH